MFPSEPTAGDPFLMIYHSGQIFNIFTLRLPHLLFLEIESVTPSVCGDYLLDVG